MSDHQAACVQLLRQRSILIKEYRMYNNIHNTTDRGEQRHWFAASMIENIRKDIKRMTRIIKGK